MVIREEQEFAVLGIVARTNNSREMTPDGVIPKLWARFMGENILARIPNRLDSAVIALYTAYESDEKGEYDILLGARVASGSPVPDGMVVRNIPSARYAIIESARGPVRQVVPQAWQRVWKEIPNRAFQSDYELYGTRATEPDNAIVELHIGIK